jgi:DNA-binding SARP family transcriptional activator
MPVSLGPMKQRLLLAALLCHANTPVSVDLLTAVIWDDKPPRTFRKNVQVYVAALRRLLEDGGGAGRLSLVAGGYMLRLEQEELDTLRFQRLAHAGREAMSSRALAAAARVLTEALSLWRGWPLPGLESSPVIQDEIERISTRYLQVYEDWAETQLRMGNAGPVAATIDEIVERYPQRERLRGAQMRALYNLGRQTQALAVYDEVRMLLATELGLRPSPALEGLHRSMLTGTEYGPAWTPAAGLSGAGGYSLLPPDLPDVTGRADQAGELAKILGQEQRRLALITGPPGVGKTAFAVHMAHELASLYPDGRLLIRMRDADGRPRPWRSVLAELSWLTGMAGVLADDPDRAAAAWRLWLAPQKMLLVLDDAADEANVRPFVPGAGGSAIVVTARSRLAGLESAYRIDMPPFSLAESIELLSRIVGAGRVDNDPGAAARIAEAAGMLPLAIRACGLKLALLRHLPLQEYAARLADTRGLLDELAVGDLEVRQRLASHWGELPEQARDVLGRLSALPTAPFTLADAAEALGCGQDVAQRELESLIDTGVISAPDHEVMAHAAFWVAVYEAIAQAAPNAAIEVAMYPKIFPANPDQCLVSTGLFRGDVLQANKDWHIANKEIGTAIKVARLMRVNVRPLNFEDALAHTNICPAGKGNIHGVNNIGITGIAHSGTMGLYHPNEAGHVALAAAYNRLAAGGFFGLLFNALPNFANGTLVADPSADAVSIVAGGSLQPVTDPADLAAAGYPASSQIHMLDPEQFSEGAPVPADGTLLKDASSGMVYQINSGQKVPYAGNPAGAVTVPGHDIAAIPDGSFRVAYQGRSGDLFSTDGRVPGDQHVSIAAGSGPSVSRMDSGALVTALRGGNGDLWLSGAVASPGDQLIAMAPNTSPVVAGLNGGLYEVAYEGANGDLWTTGTDFATTDWGAPIMAGTSPSIARLANGGFEVAITRSDGRLFVAGSSGTGTVAQEMVKAGTSPAITGLTGNQSEIAFVAPNGLLRVYGSAVIGFECLVVSPGSSPAIAALPGGAFEIAVNSGGSLWTISPNPAASRGVAMMAGSSPSMVTLDSGQVQIAYTDPAGDLHVDGGAGSAALGLAVDPGTTPSITAVNGGGYQVAISDGGELWMAPAGPSDTGQGMAPGTRPAIARLTDGTQEMAVQLSSGALWLDGPDATLIPSGASVIAGTSPAITGLDSGGFVAAWQGGNGDLWTYQAGGSPADTGLAMAAGTSPSIAAQPGGTYVIAFQSSGGQLELDSPAGITTNLGAMAAGTSPSVTDLGGGPEVAFQGSNGNLWLSGTSAAGDQGQAMMTTTSPAITTADGTWEAVFQSSAGTLWTDNPVTGAANTQITMEANTSPAITGLPVGGYEAAIVEGTTGRLWTVGPTARQPRGIAVNPGSSPAIAPAI